MARDELKQPLQKRSLRTRLWQARPSAIVTGYAVVSLSFAAGGGWLLKQPMPFAGEPLVSLQIAPIEKIQTAKVEPVLEAPSPDMADIQTAATDAAPEPEPKPQKITKLDQYVTVVSNSRQSLVKAPVAANTEDSPEGPLPHIASSGKKPSEVYAKSVGMNTIHSDAPKIVIILGGMGLNEKLTRRAITDLPGEVTFAFAPYGNSLQGQVDSARQNGHEILLQLPLEPVGFPATNPGPKTLLADADQATNEEALHWHMSRFQGYAGVINYMGGRYLSAPPAIKTLLIELKRRGLWFFEDGSLPLSATDQVAGSLNMPVRHGGGVIDVNPDTQSITAALNALEEQAHDGGIAIGTGSGLDVTIDAVRDWIKDAQSRGVIIVPATAAFKGRLG
jgi:uncharacterized protein